MALPTVISVARANASPTNAAKVSFTVTFSEAVTGVDKYDFSLVSTEAISGAGITSVSGSGATRVISVNTGTGSGTLQLDLVDNDSIKDLGKNPLGGPSPVNGNFTTGETYIVDKTSPMVVSIVRASPDNTSAAVVNFLVTFTRPVAGVDRYDFRLTSTDTISDASIISVGGVVGTTRTVTVYAGNGSGTLDLDLVDNDTIRDVVRNPLGGGGLVNGDYIAGEIYTIERTPPTVVSIMRTGADPTSASTVNFTVTFSESVTGVDKYDFNLITTGDVAGASILSVSGTGTVRTVTVNTGTGSGTLQLDLVDNDTIWDMKHNLLGGSGAGNGNFTGQGYMISRP
jgi:hypothetical protein